MTSTVTPNDDGVATEYFHSQFFDHLGSYTVVDYACKTAQACYSRVKSSNRVLKYGFETAESVSRVALPLVKTAEPWLTRADEFSLHQLERLEDKLAKPCQTVVQLPYTLMDKTLNIGEDTLEHWLPVEEDKKLAKLHADENKDDKSLVYFQKRAYYIINAFQLRAKDRLYSVPVVGQSVDFVSARVKDTKALVKRAAATPAAVRVYYQQRRDQLVARVMTLYSQLLLAIHTVFDRAYDLGHKARSQFDHVRSLTLQELGVAAVNRAHDLWQYLASRLFPEKFVSASKDRFAKAVTQLNELNPLKEKEATTEQAGEKEKEAVPPRKPGSGKRSARGRGKQIAEVKSA